ncbi:MAG: sulfotransferase [Alphaproteobacteria bacterium]
MDTLVTPVGDSANTLSELLAQACDAMQGGRFDEAAQTCESIVGSYPEQPDAWFLLGVAALRDGKTDIAIAPLLRAVDIRRGHAPYRIALGQALLKTGDAAPALEHFRAARLLDLQSHEAAFGMAASLSALGQSAEAAEAHKNALALVRDAVGRRFRKSAELKAIRWSALVQSPLGNAQQREFKIALRLARREEMRGEIASATRSYAHAHSLNPTHLHPLHAMGRLAFDAENFLLSRDNLEQARQLAPDNLEIECDYARALSRLAHHEDALRLLEEAHNSAPDAIRPLLLLGWARYRAGQSQRAIADFDAVLDQLPRSIEAHYGRARALVDAGQSQESILWMQRTVALAPDHAGALRELANLKELTPESPAFAPLLGALDDPAGTAPRRAVLHMAAGAGYINGGDHDQGFEHYRQGNQLKDTVFDIDAYAQHLDAIMARFDTSHFERTAEWGDTSEVPVFVLGMPRSGTSLVEQILASHSDVYGAGEREDMLRLADSLPEALNDSRPYPHCLSSMTRPATAQISGDFLKSLRRVDPHALRIIDKMPGNFHHIGLIATLFPNARIIHCQRDPRDTCLSIYFGDFVGSHPYSYDLTNLGRYHNQYERLMRHWNTVLPGRILDVRYEDLVDDQEGWSRKMVAFAGLDWDPACIEFHKTKRNVRTRSNDQVRRPIYRSSLGRWKTYEAHLQPLFDGLDGR